MNAIGHKTTLCLREPSLGPVFGVKGGATGAGFARILPEDDINLHFTGDFHAITSTINLISAMIENSLYQENSLNIDPDKIVWKRAVDMNDRSLREIYITAAGKKSDKSSTSYRYKTHRSEYVITAASELMAVFCLAKDEEDFLNRAEKMIVAYTLDDLPVTVAQLHIRTAIKKLMHTALFPNLVQTNYGNPVIIHGGPFANIAHGCNSVIATKTALSLSPIVVTEAGFGADLGAEKFMDLKCQFADIKPDLNLLVITVRALKLHGGVKFENLSTENLQAVKDGLANLKRHAENLKKYGIPLLVAINKFTSDTEAEISIIKEFCTQNNLSITISNVMNDPKAESEAKFAADICNKLNEKSDFTPLYRHNDISTAEDKIEKICKEIYRAEKVIYSDDAKVQLTRFKELGYSSLPVCIAKTPNSFTDDPTRLNAPINFDITIREIRLAAGAGFLIPLTGDVMTMPGLPKVPNAVEI